MPNQYLFMTSAPGLILLLMIKQQLREEHFGHEWVVSMSRKLNYNIWYKIIYDRFNVFFCYKLNVINLYVNKMELYHLIQNNLWQIQGIFEK